MFLVRRGPGGLTRFNWVAGTAASGIRDPLRTPVSASTFPVLPSIRDRVVRHHECALAWFLTRRQTLRERKVMVRWTEVSGRRMALLVSALWNLSFDAFVANRRTLAEEHGVPVEAVEDLVISFSMALMDRRSHRAEPVRPFSSSPSSPSDNEPARRLPSDHSGTPVQSTIIVWSAVIWTV